MENTSQSLDKTNNITYEDLDLLEETSYRNVYKRICYLIQGPRPTPDEILNFFYDSADFAISGDLYDRSSTFSRLPPKGGYGEKMLSSDDIADDLSISSSMSLCAGGCFDPTKDKLTKYMNGVLRQLEVALSRGKTNEEGTVSIDEFLNIVASFLRNTQPEDRLAMLHMTVEEDIDMIDEEFEN